MFPAALGFFPLAVFPSVPPVSLHYTHLFAMCGLISLSLYIPLFFVCFFTLPYLPRLCKILLYSSLSRASFQSLVTWFSVSRPKKKKKRPNVNKNIKIGFFFLNECTITRACVLQRAVSVYALSTVLSEHAG